MGRLNSLADVLADWEELLEAVRRSPDLLPDVEEDVEILADLLAEARQHKARQNEMTALRQEVTQKLNAELARGKVTAIGMRAVVRGKLGPRSELLVQFGIAPLRKRRPVKKISGYTPVVQHYREPSLLDVPVVLLVTGTDRMALLKGTGGDRHIGHADDPAPVGEGSINTAGQNRRLRIELKDIDLREEAHELIGTVHRTDSMETADDFHDRENRGGIPALGRQIFGRPLHDGGVFAFEDFGQDIGVEEDLTHQTSSDAGSTFPCKRPRRLPPRDPEHLRRDHPGETPESPFFRGCSSKAPRS